MPYEFDGFGFLSPSTSRPIIELAQLELFFLLPKVSWIRERDTTLISVGRYTYTTDQGRRSFNRASDTLEGTREKPFRTE